MNYPCSYRFTNSHSIVRRAGIHHDDFIGHGFYRMQAAGYFIGFVVGNDDCSNRHVPMNLKQR